MTKSSHERRKYERYDTKAEIYFRVSYAVTTKLKFQVQGDRASRRKYAALSRNVSAEGLSFVARKQLAKGDRLYLEVYLPKAKAPIMMQGDVRWSDQLPAKSSRKKIYETGVKISSVEGQCVEKTIYFDKTYQVIWSTLLESVLGNFRIISRRLSSQREKGLR